MPNSPSPRIVFLDADSIGTVPNVNLIEQLGDYQAFGKTSPDQVVERLRGARVVITNKVKITADHLDELPDLGLICVAATGTNNIDHAAAKARNIPVRNVAGYSTESVAQLTLTSLFTVAMDLIHLNQAVYDGTYSSQPGFSYWRQPFYQLNGARYGIIGLGNIGKRVGALARAYGAEVVYYSTSGNHNDPNFQRVDFPELLSSCEVISIHAPLNEATENLITKKELQQMRSSAYLLNMGRGGIVNEADLATAIDEATIAGAAVDVFTQEPLPSDHPYLGVKNRRRLLLTPHIGWASVEARMELVKGIAQNISNWLESDR